jgi:hypothetical protein
MSKDILEQCAVVLTSHPRQQKWFEPVLIALENYPGPLIMVYDDVDLAAIPDEILRRFAIAEPTGYPAGQLGHGRGELVCMRQGFRLAAELAAAFCFKLGFDEPPWRWRNLRRLLDQIYEKQIDLMDCDTRAILGRTGALVSIMEAHDVVARGYGAAENYWRSVCKERNIDRLFIRERQYWEIELGLLHLQGEYAHNVGQKNRYSWNIGEIWPRENAAITHG